MRWGYKLGRTKWGDIKVILTGPHHGKPPHTMRKWTEIGQFWFPRSITQFLTSFSHKI